MCLCACVLVLVLVLMLVLVLVLVLALVLYCVLAFRTLFPGALLMRTCFNSDALCRGLVWRFHLPSYSST